MPGRVLVIGGRGYVGQALVRALAARGHAVVVAGRLPPASTQVPFVACDAADPISLRAALVEADWVVNAMAGPAAARVAVAANLAALLERLPALRLIHISSLAVFGQRDGVLSESVAPLPARRHAYGAACLRAERALRAVPESFARTTILRVGCVYGPHSQRWVDLLCALLCQGRVGGLGAAGAGDAPLIHVRDLAQCLANGLEQGLAPGLRHVLAPEVISWAGYMRQLAEALGLADLPDTSAPRLALESWVLGPARLLLARAVGGGAAGMTPALLRLFSGQAQFATHFPPLLDPARFTPLADGIAEAAGLFAHAHGMAGGARLGWQPGVAA